MLTLSLPGSNRTVIFVQYGCNFVSNEMKAIGALLCLPLIKLYKVVPAFESVEKFLSEYLKKDTEQHFHVVVLRSKIWLRFYQVCR